MRSARHFLLAATAAAAAAAASPTAPEQVHLTLHPDPDMLVVTWHSREAAATSSTVQYGAERSRLNGTARGGPGSALVYVVDTCPENSTRASHFVAFPAPRHRDTYYRVSGDGGASWSAVFGPTRAPAPLADGSLTVSLFGDLGVETAPAPNAVAALVNDTRRGAAGHQLIVHFGDTAYNMNDECGAKGDRFLNAAQEYAAITPVAWGNGNHARIINNVPPTTHHQTPTDPCPIPHPIPKTTGDRPGGWPLRVRLPRVRRPARARPGLPGCGVKLNERALVLFLHSGDGGRFHARC